MIGSIVIGLAAGMVAGMLGVGGGVLFVPGLVLFVSLSQVDAEATSLVAIVPVALVGAYQQYRYGNVRVPDAALIGTLSIVGAISGVALANVLPERALKLGFAALMLLVAFRLVRKALREPGTSPGPAGSD
ncbi:MAG TPA: sulfite exporter TauE/SafE family protein [Solirubrobacteraceae bacterium]|jgi:hypothetical protein|nr:sulfite exporter TauE/SafE family protein [Solirubrobacteraceae bacterium]